jgi:hypothetical protein
LHLALTQWVDLTMYSRFADRNRASSGLEMLL